jgi:hypothetical protein
MSWSSDCEMPPPLISQRKLCASMTCRYIFMLDNLKESWVTSVSSLAASKTHLRACAIWLQASTPLSWETFKFHVLINIQLPCLEKPSASMSWKTFNFHVLRKLKFTYHEKPSTSMSWETFNFHVLRNLQLPCREKPSTSMAWETFNFHVLRKLHLLHPGKTTVLNRLTDETPRYTEEQNPECVPI